MSHCVRSITFTIPGSLTSPDVQVYVEELNGKLVFTASVIESGGKTADLRGLFFNLNDDSKLAGLTHSGSGGKVTDFDTVNVIDLGQGANMQGVHDPYDVGLEFGREGIGKDDIKTATFTLSNTANNLTLDDIAQVDFGARLTSVGNIGGLRDDGSKLTATAPAAPDAKDDSYSIYEDGQSGLNDPSKVSEGVKFEVLTNDTDADGDTLTITSVEGAQHGTVTIIDGDDADLLVGDAVLYTPDLDYAGSDSFTYSITDNQGGTDFATVNVAVAAVADVPLLTYTTAPGALVNEILINVTATQNDQDGSEFIDRIVTSSVPDGVTITPAGINPGDQPGQIVQQFKVTLPLGQDQNFDLGFTAVAKENDSVGDEQESAILEIPIAFKSQSITEDVEYKAEQNLWGLGPEQSFDLTIPYYLFGKDLFAFPPQLGLLPTIDVGLDKSILGGAVDIDGDFFLETGFNFDFSLKGGSIDAASNYSLGLTTNYNVTTDTALVSSSKDLLSSSFATTFPFLTFGLDFFYDLDAALKIKLDGGILGSETLDVFDVDISGTQTVLSETNISELLDLTVFAYPNPQSITPPPPAPQVPVPNPLAGPFFVNVDWPEIDITAGPVDNNVVVGSGESDIILGLAVDVDKLFFPPLGLGFEDSKLGFGVEASLLDLDVEGGLSLNQEHTLTLEDVLLGNLLLEDGTQISYTVGDDARIDNFSSHDLNGDGEVEIQFEGRPLASFNNDTDLGLTFLYELQALFAEAKAPILGSASVSAYDKTESITPVDFDLFNSTFDLAYANAATQSLYI